MHQDTHWYDKDLWQLLSQMEVVDYTLDEGESKMNEHDYDWTLVLNIEFGPAFLKETLMDKRDYLLAAHDEEPEIEEVTEEVVNDLAYALDITYNEVGSTGPDDGPYEKINDTQWKKRESADLYGKYSDLLWELTDGEENLSVPALRRPFLAACAESDDHTLPPEPAVDSILMEHFEDVRHEKKSRKAQSALKRELEKRGVNARNAASIAKQMEDFLISDSELEEKMKEKN